MSERDESGRYLPGHDSAGPGRPSLYREEYADQARKFCLLGATNERLAELFDVEVATIHNWMHAHPAFLDGIKSGRDIADAKMAESLFHRGCGYRHEAIHFATVNGEVVETPYTKHYPPDTTAATMWLKNRQPALWRDKTEVDLNGKLTVVDKDMPLDEATRVYEANLKALRGDE